MGLNNKISLVTQAISTVLGVTAHAIKCATSFVELGGDSLSAILISAECQRHGIAIATGVFLRAYTLEEAITKAVLSAQNLPATPTPQASKSHSKTITSLKATSTSHERGISARHVLDKVEAANFTESQLLLLRGSLHDPNLNMVALHETYTEWDITTVCKAWTSVVLAEPIFTDLAHELDISPPELLLWQTILVDTNENFKREVLNTANSSDTVSRLTAIQSQNDATSITVVWRVHHAFIDGYAARVLLDKVDRTLRGETVAPGPSFREMTRLLRKFQDERRVSTRRFWANKRNKFPGATSELQFRTRNAEKSRDNPQGRIAIQFPDEKLTAATGRTGYTKAVYFAAAWALTLSKFTNADQVYFGVVFSGRDLPIPGALATIGSLINILPLFVSAKDDHKVSREDLLRHVHEAVLDLNDFQHSETADGFDRRFDSVMATQFECDRATSKEAASVDHLRSDMQSGVPLNLIIEQQSCVQMLYSTAKYTEADVVNIRSVFQHSMNCLLQADAKLDDTLPPNLERKIRQWSNCGSWETFDDSKGDDLVTLFQKVVARRPDDVAIMQGDIQVSYDAFDKAADAVALRLTWIEPNEAVCVFADRSVNWLIAIFGILKAGGVYAPLDPFAPVAVRHANFVHSGARAVVVPSCASRSNCLSHWYNEPTFQCLVVEEIIMDAQIRGFVAHRKRCIPRPDDLAYICFTSGSTGQPKAVKCTHKGLVAFQKDREVRLAAAPGIVVAQTMSPVFDGSIHEIFSALSYGAALRIASPDQEEPFSHLQESDSAILTPSIAKALDPNRYARLRNVYLVGEAVPQSVCDAWAKGRSLFNMYGPTEATCGATIKRLLPGEVVTLGRPNPSSRVYVLDRSHRLLPPGAVGEVYLAGIQISHGYIDLPTENVNRFLDDCIMPQVHEKMYKSGDYGYWDSVTGEICLVGRKDRQIKLRGFRLDLDDLEARVVKAIPGCQGAAIFRRDDYLIAAYLATSVNSTSAKALIRQILPPYAMPRSVIALDNFPLTTAGKLDYKALEAIKMDVEIESPAFWESMTATENMLVDAIRSLLKLGPDIVVDRNSDFTILGGHSILQLQLTNRISAFFQHRFTVRTVIENPVISQLASIIDANLRDNSNIDHQSLRDSTDPLGEAGVSPIELYWFSKYKQNLGSSSFNVSHVSKLNDNFNQHEALVLAWDIVLARHSILRCRFRESIHGVTRIHATEAPRATYLETFNVRDSINLEFLLDREDPIRVMVSEHYMLVCVSHVVCDYTTLNHLLEEFTTAYFDIDMPTASRSYPITPIYSADTEHRARGTEHSSSSSLKRKHHETSNSDAPSHKAQKIARTDSGLTSQHLRRYQDTQWNKNVAQVTTDFWKSYLSDMDLLKMPYMRQNRISYSGNSSIFKLSTCAISNLRMVSQTHGFTSHQIALGIVSLVLQADSTSKQDLLLGSPYLGRQEEDMRTIGLFLQPLPIRIRRSDPKAPIATFLKTIQKSAQSALSHGIDWSSLMNILASSDDEVLRTAVTTAIPNHPLFDAMVTFHELRHDQSTKIAGVEPQISWADGSKFTIMIEFSAISFKSVTLRIEHDKSLFSSKEVETLGRRINKGLELICETLTVEGLEQSLASADCRELEPVEFGTPMADLAQPSLL